MALLLILLGCCLNVNAEVSGSLSPEASIQLLYGQGDKTLNDGEGYKYRVFYVRPESELQNLIDTITKRLLRTVIGSALCRGPLRRNPDLISTHLGISETSSAEAARDCASSGSRHVSEGLVFDSPHQGPKRLTGAGISQRRQYIFVVTDRPHPPVDSWTEAYSNTTTLFMHHSAERSDLNLRYLTQAIAHEMAIYFDAKVWPWGPDWHRLYDLGNVVGREEIPADVMMAALNPAIATVLSFIRAYKIERQMLRDLASQRLLVGLGPILYPQSSYPFLRLSCGGECLMRFILAQREWLSPLYRALLAFSPHYRVRRLEYERMRALSFNRPMNERLLKALELFPQKYLDQTRSGKMMFENLLLPPDNSTDESVESEITNAIMETTLLPSDLKILSEAQVQIPFRSGTIDILTYLSIPLLSDANSGISSGPRPRIRTGATR